MINEIKEYILVKVYLKKNDFKQKKIFIAFISEIGLPVIREQPWEYKFVFSLIGIVGQFVFPFKVVKNYEIEVIEACSQIKQIEVDDLGTLEAFTTNTENRYSD